MVLCGLLNQIEDLRLFDLELCLYMLVCKVHLRPALPYPELTNGISYLLQVLPFLLLCEEGERTQCSVFMNSDANNF